MATTAPETDALTTLEAIPYVVRLDVPAVQRTQVAQTSPSVFLGLYDNGAAVRSKLGQVQAHATNLITAPFGRSFIWTPAAGSRTPQLRAYTNTADDWTALAGNADGDTYGPITIELYRTVPAT